jgi:UDP-glucose 4-epimerase
MKALVTGSSGFIGRHLLRALGQDERFQFVVGLSRHNYSNVRCTGRVMEVQCDIADERAVKTRLAAFKPDVIFHLAANPLTRVNEDDPCRITRDNVLLTHHMLEYAPPGCRFVYFSSAAVYGNNACLPVPEIAPSPSSVYGATKVAGESLVEAYTRLAGEWRIPALRGQRGHRSRPRPAARPGAQGQGSRQ